MSAESEIGEAFLALFKLAIVLCVVVGLPYIAWCVLRLMIGG